MSSWDIFQGVTLELQRELTTRQVRAALAAGELRDDDLARPSGTGKPWLPISQIDELMAADFDLLPPPSLPEPPPTLPSIASVDFELGSDPTGQTMSVSPRPDSLPEPSDVSFPVLLDRDIADQAPPPSETQIPSSQFRLSPAESSPHVPAQFHWGWDVTDDDEDEDEDIPAPAPTPTEYDLGEPTAPFSDTPARPVERTNPGLADLDSRISQESSSHLAIPVPSDRSSLIALPVVSERSSQLALPAVGSRDWNGIPIAPGDEGDPEEETFTFARRSTAKVEELDLAPMVDVAFQLVLFFMLTATTVLYKTLEVPKPSGERPPGALAQGKIKTVEDLREDFIVVEIDPSGAFKIDREPVVAEMDTLVEKLRTARDKTARLAMLLSADFATPHRFAVLAIDAANEIGLRIAVARPQGRQSQTPAPSLFPLNPTRSTQTKGDDSGA